MSSNVECSSLGEMTSSESFRVTIRSMTAEVLPAVCDLHMDAAPSSASVRLGRRYVLAFMSWFITAGNAVACVAETDSGQIVGYVIGAPVGYSASLNMQLAIVGAMAILTRPWMLFDRRVWKTVKARVGFVFTRSASNPTGLPTPVMSLVGVAVAPSAAGRGVGVTLIKEFEERARGLRMAALRLSVFPENTRARRLYERCGWHALPCPPASNGTVYYGLILE